MQGASRPDSTRLDAWLSRVCGFPCFSMSAPTGGTLPSVAPAAGNAFFFAKVPVADVAAVNAFARLGLRVVDVNLVLERAGEDRVPPADRTDPAEGPASAAEADDAIGIAGSCFRQSRFHLDPDFPRELADAIKREWVGSYARGERGSELLVARRQDATAGFLAVLEQPDAACIDLVGVDAAYQGRGVGRALVLEFARRWGPRKARLRVGTQAANIGSLRMYEGCGFRMAQASYVMHAHVRDGRLLG